MVAPRSYTWKPDQGSGKVQLYRAWFTLDVVTSCYEYFDHYTTESREYMNWYNTISFYEASIWSHDRLYLYQFNQRFILNVTGISICGFWSHGQVVIQSRWILHQIYDRIRSGHFFASFCLMISGFVSYLVVFRRSVGLYSFPSAYSVYCRSDDYRAPKHTWSCYDLFQLYAQFIVIIRRHSALLLYWGLISLWLLLLISLLIERIIDYSSMPHPLYMLLLFSIFNSPSAPNTHEATDVDDKKLPCNTILLHSVVNDIWLLISPTCLGLLDGNGFMAYAKIIRLVAKVYLENHLSSFML